MPTTPVFHPFFPVILRAKPEESVSTFCHSELVSESVSKKSKKRGLKKIFFLKERYYTIRSIV